VELLDFAELLDLPLLEDFFTEDELLDFLLLDEFLPFALYFG
jgi:hypothetical protein